MQITRFRIFAAKFEVVFLLSLFVPVNAARAVGNLSLDEFVERAVKNNLDLRLAEAEVGKAKAHSSGVRIPAPQIALNQMNMNGGGTARGWQVSQSIPFPTKIHADYRARETALQGETQRFVAKSQEIKAMARYIYFFVWQAQERERILQEKEGLLKKHLSVARSVARSDTFSQIHLLKVESEIDQLKNELTSVEQVQKERMTIAAQFLDADPAEFSFQATDPGLAVLPQIGDIVSIPQVKALEHQVQTLTAREREKKTNWLPEVNVSYNHMEQTMRFPEFNQITVGVTLPFLYFWQPKSNVGQAIADKHVAEIELQKTKRSIQADKVNLTQTIESLKKQIVLLSNDVLQRAYKRKKLFEYISPRDLSSLQEHLDTYLSIPNIQLQILALKEKYEQATAQLAKYKSIEEPS